MKSNNNVKKGYLVVVDGVSTFLDLYNTTPTIMGLVWLHPVFIQWCIFMSSPNNPYRNILLCLMDQIWDIYILANPWHSSIICFTRVWTGTSRFGVNHKQSVVSRITNRKTERQTFWLIDWWLILYFTLLHKYIDHIQFYIKTTIEPSLLFCCVFGRSTRGLYIQTKPDNWTFVFYGVFWLDGIRVF